MPRRTVPLVAGEYYHLYNRGNNRQKIFFERENYLFFLRRIRQYLLGETQQTSEVSETSEVSTTIVAYCLMPNHFHILLCPHDNDLSHRIQLFSISYTKAINKRYDRTGSLFEGQFQAVHIDRNDYLLHLSRYLHLNPVKARLVRRPDDWEFSSYREFVGLRQGTLPTPDIVLAQFLEQDGYSKFVASYAPRDKDYIAHLLLDDED